MNLDKTDTQILAELQNNCRQSSYELSKKLKIPKSTIHRRVSKYERQGIILRYSAVLNPELVGQTGTALCLVKLEKQFPAKKGELPIKYVSDKLAEFEEIQEVHAIAGDIDIIFKVKGKNEKDVGNWIMTKLQEIPHLRSVSTNIVYYTSKDTLNLKISNEKESTRGKNPFASKK